MNRNKNSISGCTYFFFTGNLNTWLPETHPTQIRTLFGFVNPYELLDAPLLIIARYFCYKYCVCMVHISVSLEISFPRWCNKFGLRLLFFLLKLYWFLSIDDFDFVNIILSMFEYIAIVILSICSFVIVQFLLYVSYGFYVRIRFFPQTIPQTWPQTTEWAS